MKRMLPAVALASALSSACTISGDKRHGVPPPRPGKIALTTCTADTCDVIPVNARWVNGVCTTRFQSLGVRVQSGVTATFLLFSATPEVRFRFSDPGNARGDAPGIDIDYAGDPPAFRVGYAQVVPPNPAAYEARALSPPPVRGRYYPFKIRAEWSSDGQRWAPCTELDPVIAND